MNDKIRAATAELQKRVEARVARGLPRDKALMLTVMELGGKITIVRG
jgi:hypothetical protein